MQTYLIERPTEDVVTYAEAKAHLGLTDDTKRTSVEAMISAAVGELDAASNGWLGRALRPQTWELRVDASDYRFACGRRIELPFPPLLSVLSVTYDDIAGDEQTLSTGSYRVLGIGARGRGAVEPIYGGSWPDYRRGTEALRIRYEAGYEAGSSDGEDELPRQIKAAVLLSIKSLWDLQGRDTYLRSVTHGDTSTSWAISDDGRQVLGRTAQALLFTLKVWD